MGRILVFGGSGRIGWDIVTGLARCGEQVTVADLRPPDDPTTAYLHCDVTDEAAVRRAVTGYDLVVHAAGPYYRYGDRLAATAVAAGVPYLDVCDDADVAEAVLALHDAARAAEVPVVTGAGFSPGIVNAVALCLAAGHDEVDEVMIGWLVGADSPTGPTQLDHWFHCITEQVPVWQDGRRTVVEPYQADSEEVVDFPEPVGTVRVRTVGHPETVTLPRYLRAAKVTNKGALWPPGAVQTFDSLARLGLLSSVPVTVGEVSVSPRELTAAVLTRRHNARLRDDPLDRISYHVRVTSGDTTATATWAARSKEVAATAVPAVAAARLVLAGDVPRGAHGPEVLPIADWFNRIDTLAPEFFGGLVVSDQSGTETVAGLSELAARTLGRKVGR